MKAYVDLHGHPPTNRQLVEADMAHLPQAYHDLVASMAEGSALVEADSNDEMLAGDGEDEGEDEAAN